MRTLTFLASVFALTIAASACTTETAEPSTGGTKPKTGSTKKPKPGAGNQNGEHGENTPATTGDDDEEVPLGTALDEKLATGTTISANRNVEAGKTVTIDPGATINVAAGVSITIKGTLKVASAATHAKLTGTGWGGLIIAEGGKLEANGLDITGAKAALYTQKGNGPTKFENGIITAETPFKMDAGSNLTVVKTKATATAGSAIAGTFNASYLDYDKGTAPGLTMNDPAGTFTATDSNFHGTGKGGDFIISSGAKELTLAYTKVANSHCGLHFSAVDKFSLDHVTIESNDYGAMLYGSGAGPHTIKDTAFLVNADFDAHVQGQNGPINATGSVMKDQPGTSLTQTNKVTAVTGAGPRPE